MKFFFSNLHFSLYTLLINGGSNWFSRNKASFRKSFKFLKQKKVLGVKSMKIYQGNEWMKCTWNTGDQSGNESRPLKPVFRRLVSYCRSSFCNILQLSSFPVMHLFLGIDNCYDLKIVLGSLCVWFLTKFRNFFVIPASLSKYLRL